VLIVNCFFIFMCIYRFYFACQVVLYCLLFYSVGGRDLKNGRTLKKEKAVEL